MCVAIGAALVIQLSLVGCGGDAATTANTPTSNPPPTTPPPTTPSASTAGLPDQQPTGSVAEQVAAACREQQAAERAGAAAYVAAAEEDLRLAKQQQAAAQRGDVDGFVATLDDVIAQRSALDQLATSLGATDCVVEG